MVDILKAAKAAITAYTSALSLGANPSIPLSDVASAMADLFLPNMTSFVLGAITVFPDNASARTAIETALGQYNASGLGTDIRLHRSRVEALSDQSAICWIAYKVVPRNGDGPFTFTDVYGFRIAADRPRGLPGGWEWSNADDEFQTLMERYPDFPSLG